jgi:hypothetical protein
MSSRPCWCCSWAGESTTCKVMTVSGMPVDQRGLLSWRRLLAWLRRARSTRENDRNTTLIQAAVSSDQKVSIEPVAHQNDLSMINE